MKHYSETVQNPERKVFFLLAAILLCLFAVYGFLLNATIVRVVAREAAIGFISELDVQLGELEFSYISLQNTIDLNMAYNRNFVDAPSPIFISRESSGRSLSLLPNQGEL
ncbi:MAG: hypothetical protein G01um101448_607 [Parcubacteria group bacterium Gr01-1014_48]|nr:MAG: hypothetical protein Greene041614_465 [Parcubacteria group bacterium Greene0416_14]TSC73718.1 MAG: hypothetical protein G01um101448_607 [Parcubacteria group bacterium Gr01-1014_48]TSD01000.1 MAG: hypothetical protein Greene101415_573 [Parcubacteria group bacterium Greene1014_15]TSD08105.1 MAG: hypothetical protein Greene07144_389 [Parcubacteria group bacterium Greene0714_4]